MGSRQETIELGGSELGGFLGGSFPPPFPPLRTQFFFWVFFWCFFTLVFSPIFFSFLRFSFPSDFKFSLLVPSVGWYFSHESHHFLKESRPYSTSTVTHYYITDNIHIGTHFDLVLTGTLIMAANAPDNSPPSDCSGNLNLPEEFLPWKELLLASWLKQTNELIKEDGVTQIAYVVSFNSGLLRSKCIKSSANYDPDIDPNLLVRHIFPPDQWWANRTLLLDALRDFGKLLGFRPVVKHNNIQCNRYGKKEYSRSYQSGQLKRECTFKFNIKAYYNPKLGPKTNIADRQETKQVKTCKGIMCGERVDGYKFMCNFLIRNTPGCDPDKVRLFWWWILWSGNGPWFGIPKMHGT